MSSSNSQTVLQMLQSPEVLAMPCTNRTLSYWWSTFIIFIRWSRASFSIWTSARAALALASSCLRHSFSSISWNSWVRKTMLLVFLHTFNIIRDSNLLKWHALIVISIVWGGSVGVSDQFPVNDSRKWKELMQDPQIPCFSYAISILEQSRSNTTFWGLRMDSYPAAKESKLMCEPFHHEFKIQIWLRG